MYTERIIHNSGFTLIELVITLVISAIIASMISVFITRPILAYSDVARRVGLVDQVNMAERRMTRDIQRAVPNSIRTKTATITGGATVQAIEMMNVVEGKRYRAVGTGALSFSTPAPTTFNLFDPLQVASTAVTTYRLAIYNTGAYVGSTDSPTAGENVYSTATGTGGTVTITPAATTVTLSFPAPGTTTETLVTLSSGVLFANASPTQRISIIDTPVTYICNTTAGTLTRYSNYTIASVQPVDPTLAPLSGATSAQVAKNVAGCVFTYTPGTPQNNGTVTMQITLTDKETVTLLRQVGVDNVP